VGFFSGTFLPFLRASERPMAMACFRLFTVPPFPPLPLLRVPFLRRHTDRGDDDRADHAAGSYPGRYTIILARRSSAASFTWRPCLVPRLPSRTSPFWHSDLSAPKAFRTFVIRLTPIRRRPRDRRIASAPVIASTGEQAGKAVPEVVIQLPRLRHTKILGIAP
jgi:hypothetical protein